VRKRPLTVAPTAAVAAVAATAPAAATAVATATAAAPAAAEPTAATAATRLALARFVDGERSSIEWLAVELSDGALRVFLVREFDEREPARLTGHPVGHDADADDFAPTCCACLAKRGFVCVI